MIEIIEAGVNKPALKECSTKENRQPNYYGDSSIPPSYIPFSY
jgi:hypothetical protein